MNSAVINLKINPETKRQAQEVAEELGFSLSSLINGYLKQLIKTRTVTFSDVREEPNAYIKRMLKKAEKEIAAGDVVTFQSGIDALDDLDAIIAGDEQSKKNRVHK